MSLDGLMQLGLALLAFRASPSSPTWTRLMGPDIHVVRSPTGRLCWAQDEAPRKHYLPASGSAHALEMSPQLILPVTVSPKWQEDGETPSEPGSRPPRPHLLACPTASSFSNLLPEMIPLPQNLI